MMSFKGVRQKEIDTVQSYVGGVLISTGYADRQGDIASRDGIFYKSMADFFDTTVEEWRQKNGGKSVKIPRTMTIKSFWENLGQYSPADIEIHKKS
jgi:hypothetical protein